jgi:hypothetical protein
MPVVESFRRLSVWGQHTSLNVASDRVPLVCRLACASILPGQFSTQGLSRPSKLYSSYILAGNKHEQRARCFRLFPTLLPLIAWPCPLGQLSPNIGTAPLLSPIFFPCFILTSPSSFFPLSTVPFVASHFQRQSCQPCEKRPYLCVVS